MSVYPSSVRIYEVGPRDGLQNEAQIVPAETKIALIDKLSETGLTWIEAASFVSPRWVPQMADAADIMAGIRRQPSVRYPVLVPNEKGMAAALAAGVADIAVFAAASESFSRQNINCSIDESFERFRPVMAMAQDAGVAVRGYVSCVAGCPYEGAISPEAVADVAVRLYDAGCYEISLGDTIGIGTPDTMRALLDYVVPRLSADKLALHCHDTHGRALANIRVGLAYGIAVIDSAVGGLGGCPYAEGASGNVATEDVLALLAEMGIETGVNRAGIIEAAWFAAQAVGRVPRSRAAQEFKKKDDDHDA